MTYQINFVDGYDLHFKTYKTEAETEDEAIHNLYVTYGDFDHHIISIKGDETMKYFKQYKDGNSEPFEITKDEARRTLEGNWKPEALADIFGNEKMFRLWTPFSVVWTQSEDGCVPQPGFAGVCE